MAKKGKSARAERRERARAMDKLGRDHEKLAKLERGGSPALPLAVTSPAEVEVHARSVMCARCGGATELVEHAAETIGGARLRVARLRCRMCGTGREVWFELAQLH